VFLNFPEMNCANKQSLEKVICIPSVSSVVYQLHFSSDDIISFYMINICNLMEAVIKSPRLKDAAVPSVFPNLASYLSKAAIKERTDPEFRCETICKRQISI
jgi:hypothetical protein